MTDTALRRVAAFAVIVVATVAAVVSYFRIYALALHLGQPRPLALLMPLSVDGAVGAASGSVVEGAVAVKLGRYGLLSAVPGGSGRGEWADW